MPAEHKFHMVHFMHVFFLSFVLHNPISFCLIINTCNSADQIGTCIILAQLTNIVFLFTFFILFRCNHFTFFYCRWRNIPTKHRPITLCIWQLHGIHIQDVMDYLETANSSHPFNTTNLYVMKRQQMHWLK